MTRVLTCGTYDLLHIGHINFLKRAKKLGDTLIVGVSSDELNIQKKNRAPIYSLLERKTIIESLKFIDEVFIETSLAEKRQYINEKNIDIFVIGDDWKGKFDELSDICKVVYLPRTPSVSTTEIIEKITLSFK